MPAAEFTTDFRINGTDYTATVDLAALMGMHELLQDRPDFFASMDDGRPGAFRVMMTTESAPIVLAIFTEPSAPEWNGIIAKAQHPMAIMNAWGVVMGLLEQAHQAWEKSSDHPFVQTAATPGG